MILITSAKYLPIEFQIELGKLPPAFVPIGNKRLYEYQVKLFNSLNEKIVLSLPQSFVLEQADKDRLKQLSVDIIFVPDNISLGESIIYCLNMLMPLNENIRILHGDTYFNNLEFYENCLVVSQIENNYDWEFLSKDYYFNNNFIYNDNTVLSGYFEIAKPYDFIKSILKSNFSYTQGLKLYSKQYPFTIVENHNWIDLGSVTSYFHFKKNITTQRAFNNLKKENGYFIKSSDMQLKIQGEINWFKNFPSLLDLKLPRFIALDINSYKTEYLYLNTLSELFVFGKLSSFVWKKIFNTLNNFLTQLHFYQSDKESKFDFLTKTTYRLQDFICDKDFDMKTIWKFKDIEISLDQMLKDLNLAIKPNLAHSFIHGDFCFSNIMYDFKSEDIKTFDPRGIDFDGNITPFGDARYDYAKLFHSCIGLYDFIIAEYYELDIIDNRINFYIKAPSSISSIQDEFLNIFCKSNKKELYAITIHLFLSMLPLHSDNKNRQMALFANAFRLYRDFLNLRS